VEASSRPTTIAYKERTLANGFEQIGDTWDRFSNPVKSRERFLVPLHVIDEAVERIKDGSIDGMIYDPRAVKLVPAK
jgi:hypothetical protein